MDRFQLLHTFVGVADSGGFAAAARKLSMSPPAVTRHVSMLEDHLGTRLFVRTTRSLRLTESGERFLGDARRILAELVEAEQAAIGSHRTVSGELRITAPVMFGRIYVAEALGEFTRNHPEVTARTVFVDRNVNLIDEGLDIAVRIGELPDSSLTAIRCGSVAMTVFAAPRYLDQHGRPRHPRELADHRIIQSVAVSESAVWPFIENERQITVSVEPQLRMNTNDAVIEAVLAGHGIARLLSYQVAPHIQQHRLEPLLQDFAPPRLPIHILHTEGRKPSAKVRAFVDFLAARLRGDPELQKTAS